MADDTLNAGAAKARITPPLDVNLIGFTSRFSSTDGDLSPHRVHDELYARALVLECGGTAIALVVCDLVGLDGFLVDDVRQRVTTATGIPGANILMSATHTHSGPGVREGIRNERQVYGPVNRAWKDDLPAQIAPAVIDAFNARRRAELGVASATVAGVGATRRLRLADGRIAGAHNYRGEGRPEGVISEGPEDDEIGVLYIRDETGAPLAALMNYACHPWISPEMFLSAEIAGKACELVEEQLGGGLALFFTGAAGDITVGGTERVRPAEAAAAQQWYDEELQRFGSAIAGSTVDAIEQLRAFESRPRLDTASRELSLAMKIPLHEMAPMDPFRLAIEELQQVPGQKLFVDGKIVTEVLALRLGDAVIAGLPGEILCSLGLDIKARCRDVQAFVIAYCYDFPGYVPASSDYADGGYEVDMSLVAPGSGEALRDSALELLQSFHEW